MKGSVRDRWTKPGPNKKRVRNDRWGRGQRWQARWLEPDGRERVQACETKEEAETVLAHVAVGGVGPRVDANLTFGDYAEAWRAKQLHHRPGTAENVEGHLRRYIVKTLGRRALVEVTRQDVQDAVTVWSASLAPSTLRVTYGYLTTIFRDAVHDGVVEASPCVRINLPRRERQRVVPLTVDQVRTIAASVPAWCRGMVLLGAGTGLRSGELRGVTADRVRDGVVDVDRQMIDVVAGMPVWGPPKSEAGVRRVPLSRVTRAALEEHQASFEAGPDGLLFTNSRGLPVTDDTATRVWSDATDGIALRDRSGWHDLRHHHASLLIAAGLSARAVADRLGHDPAVTMRDYAHLWPSDQDRALSAVDEAYGT